MQINVQTTNRDAWKFSSADGMRKNTNTTSKEQVKMIERKGLQQKKLSSVHVPHTKTFDYWINNIDIEKS